MSGTAGAPGTGGAAEAGSGLKNVEMAAAEAADNASGRHHGWTRCACLCRPLVVIRSPSVPALPALFVPH
jgi:hypothetical protein